MNKSAYYNFVDKANREYFNWMCNRVQIGNHTGKTYFFLAYILNSRKFYPLAGNDGNRIEDSVKMRMDWLDQYNMSCRLFVNKGEEEPVPADYFNGEVTVLELLVSLAIRIEEDIMQDDEKGDRTAYWFWVMLENLKLHVYSDESFSNQAEDRIHMIIDRLLERDYDDEGDGSIFPTYGHFDVHHKEIEIWKQFSAWLNYIYRED